jgi:hypothetical protein
MTINKGSKDQAGRGTKMGFDKGKNKKGGFQKNTRLLEGDGDLKY